MLKLWHRMNVILSIGLYIKTFTFWHMVKTTDISYISVYIASLAMCMLIPADTWRKMTSYKRRCDVITSHRRRYDVILALNAHWVYCKPCYVHAPSVYFEADVVCLRHTFFFRMSVCILCPFVLDIICLCLKISQNITDMSALICKNCQNSICMFLYYYFCLKIIANLYHS